MSDAFETDSNAFETDSNALDAQITLPYAQTFTATL